MCLSSPRTGGFISRVASLPFASRLGRYSVALLLLSGDQYVPVRLVHMAKKMVLIIYPFSIFFRFRSKTDFLKFTPFVSAIHLAKFWPLSVCNCSARQFLSTKEIYTGRDGYLLKVNSVSCRFGIFSKSVPVAGDEACHPFLSLSLLSLSCS